MRIFMTLLAAILLAYGVPYEAPSCGILKSWTIPRKNW